MMHSIAFLLLLSSWPALAHEDIAFTVRGPAGVQYRVSSTYTGAEGSGSTRSGTLPASGQVSGTVFGYIPHDDGDTLSASFTDTSGTVACPPLFIPIFEPLNHFQLGCNALFTFSAGRTCDSRCGDGGGGATQQGRGPRAYPNPVSTAKHGDMHFVGFPASARLRIFSLGGRLVWEGRTTSAGGLHWHVVDRDNRRLGTGVYQAVADGGVTLKIAVQR